jgi:hypothetical protein
MPRSPTPDKLSCLKKLAIPYGTLRDRLKRVSGSKISFIIDEDEQVKLFPLTVPVEERSGMLHRPGMKKTTLEEMDRAISEGAKSQQICDRLEFPLLMN